jgi:hypothetical protein
MLQPMIQQMVQQQMSMGGGGAGGAGGAAGGLKPKIDVNVEIMQIKNMLAKICDALKIQIPAQDMVATPEKLMAMSQGQSTATPGMGGAGGDPAAGGAIPPTGGMEGMAPAGVPGMGGEKTGRYRGNGQPFDPRGLGQMGNRALALAAMLRQERR